MYDELLKRLRVHHCDAKEDDLQDVCEECYYYVIAEDKSAFNGIKAVCICGLMHEAADAIEELQKQLREEKVDNVNLTGWLAEEHAKQCTHYIRNVHDRGDDSLCDKWMCEVASLPRWIPVTERLPEIGKKVLVFAYGHDVLTARLRKETENDYPVFVCNGIYLEMAKQGRITHWMPLPQPPESEDN